VSGVEAATPTLTDPTRGYAPPEVERPLGGYSVLTAVFSGVVALAASLLRRSGKELPERVSVWDVVLMGAATHKLSRMITKDKVTSFVRAPFVEYQGPGGPGEVEEKPRGSGLRYTIGELLVCPYCLGMWISAAFGLGLVAAPRITRLVASIFTALGISDFLQIAYKATVDKNL
jgi:uncharacterized protein DUF1360